MHHETALIAVVAIGLALAFLAGFAANSIGAAGDCGAELGVGLELLPREGQNLILAGALISITLNPLVFRLVSPVH